MLTPGEAMERRESGHTASEFAASSDADAAQDTLVVAVRSQVRAECVQQHAQEIERLERTHADEVRQLQDDIRSLQLQHAADVTVLQVSWQGAEFHGYTGLGQLQSGVAQLKLTHCLAACQ
jgi:hypothetical protein